jgi:hypothetical protein
MGDDRVKLRPRDELARTTAVNSRPATAKAQKTLVALGKKV